MSRQEPFMRNKGDRFGGGCQNGGQSGCNDRRSCCDERDDRCDCGGCHDKDDPCIVCPRRP